MNHWLNQCHFGDCLETLRLMPAGIVNTCVTSPPYFGLRDYGHDGQIGLEATPEQYIARLVAVFHEVRRVLADDGTLWLNIGDSYAGYHGNKNAAYDAAPSNKGGYFENQRKTLVNHNGIKNKDLIGIPWLLAFALRADGWYLRQEIIWHKPNPMPESVTDRCTKSHESIFLLAKSEKYYFDSEAMLEHATTNAPHKHWTNRQHDQSMLANKQTNGVKGRPVGVAGYSAQGMRNKRSVWTVATTPYAGAHFATFPPALIEPCILAGSPAGGVVLDCFYGSGTTGQVAQALGRNFIGCELNPAYKVLQDARTCQPSLLLEAA